MLSAVFIKCCTRTDKCGKHNSIVLNIGAFYSFYWCISGSRLLKCYKGSCCLCQHGRCCHDHTWKNMGSRWIRIEYFFVSFILSFCLIVETLGCHFWLENICKCVVITSSWILDLRYLDSLHFYPYTCVRGTWHGCGYGIWVGSFLLKLDTSPCSSKFKTK